MLSQPKHVLWIHQGYSHFLIAYIVPTVIYSFIYSKKFSLHIHDSIHESLWIYNLLHNASLLNINSNKVHQYFHDFLAACFELPVHAETHNSIWWENILLLGNSGYHSPNINTLRLRFTLSIARADFSS